jgi:hypothetical protein
VGRRAPPILSRYSDEIAAKEKQMFGGQIFIDAKLWEIQRELRGRPVRHFRGNPNAELPRQGTGIVHEVFRRIAEAA